MQPQRLPSTRLFRNRLMVDVDFLRIYEEDHPNGTLWSGYWILRSSGKIMGQGIDKIRIHEPEDWEEIPVQ